MYNKSRPPSSRGRLSRQESRVGVEEPFPSIAGKAANPETGVAEGGPHGARLVELQAVDLDRAAVELAHLPERRDAARQDRGSLVFARFRDDLPPRPRAVAHGRSGSP